MLRLICVFLGCDLPIDLLLKSQSIAYNHFHHVLIYVTIYEVCNILCLNKYICIFLLVKYQHSHFFMQTSLLISTWQEAKLNLSIWTRGKTIRIYAILRIVFECIAIYCHIAIFHRILVKRHCVWKYGFWQ